MYYPGPPPPIANSRGLNSVQREEGGELFPTHKTALIQAPIDKLDGMVGLEYIVEVRPVREGEPWYACRLCETQFRTTAGDEVSNQRKLLRHLQMISHKLNFLQTHFPKVKRLTLEEPENKCTEEGVDRVISRIERSFGHLKVKLVVGSEMYKRSEAEIDMVIKRGAHLVEDEAFVESFKKKEKHKKKRSRSRSRSQSRERKRKKRSRSISPEKTKKKSDQNIKFRADDPGHSKSKDVMMVLEKKKSKVEKKNVLRSPSRSPSPKKSKKSAVVEEKVKAEKKKRKKTRRRSSSRSSSPPSPSTLKVMNSIITKKKKKKRSESPLDRRQKIQSKKNSVISKKSKSVKEKSHSSSPSPLASPRMKKDRKSSGDKEVDLNVEERVIKFRKEENLMLEELNKEKERFYKSPSSHPRYQDEWNHFWKNQHDSLSSVTMVGGAEMSKIIEAKWVIHWKEFFDAKHESKMQERRRRLMTSNKVTISDIEKTMLKLSQEETMLKQKPLAEDVITLDDSSDEDNGNVTVADTMQNNMGNKNTSETSSEDASLLATLRLLASLDSGGSLGEGLGTKLSQLKDAALTLESGQYGSSEGLVRERECSNLLDHARERLALRIDQGRIGPGQKPAARLALENLRVLLGRVGVDEREEVLEVDTVGSAEAAIRRKVELELGAARRKVSSQDMAALIEAERVRARLSLGSGSASAFNSQHPSAASGLNMNSNLFSVYPTNQPNVQQPPFDWTAVNNIFNNQHSGSLQQQQLPVVNFQQPQNFQRWQQQAVQEQQPTTSSAIAVSSDESSPPRSFISPSIVHEQEKPTSPSMPSSSSLPTQPPNRLPNIKTEPLEGLTENELIHLVKGFKSLDKEDQHELINYMKKLERSDPAMVQRVKIGMQS